MRVLALFLPKISKFLLPCHSGAMSALLSVEIAGVEHGAFEVSLAGLGWLLGWLLLWRAEPLSSLTTAPSTTGSLATGSTPSSARDGGAAPDERAPVAVIIPARDEALSLPHLLPPLVAQRRADDRILVVDDHSSDETSRIAGSFDVDVTMPPPPADGWLGKPNACWHGASVTDQSVVVFLDADVRPGPTLLDDLAAAVVAEPNAVVSMQPWHRMETLGEQLSILCNVTALMGCGAFTPMPRWTAATVAFGPVLAVDRATYERSGGHASPSVRSMHTEDIGLARAVGRSRMAVGTPSSTTFRMYPGGFGELMRGWSRSIATGARFTRWWVGLAVAVWVASITGGWIAAPLLYPFFATQIYVLGRRAGTMRPVAAVLFPVLVVVFVAIFVRSAFAVVFRRDVTWKGRQVGARTG